MENTQFVKDCLLLKKDESIKRKTLAFEELYNLKYPAEIKRGDLSMMGVFHKFEIYANTTRDFNMRVWNGKHPPEKNTNEHICPKGSRVRIWMASRMGDIGITDNMVDPHGYDCRGVEAHDLESWELIRKS